MYIYNLALAFDEIVRQHGDRTALRFDIAQAFTYRELNGTADLIATSLIAKHGLGPGDVVCISGQKTMLTYATLLGCLKAGVAYAMLDPDTPIDRLARIFGTCR